jgi:hypothetical protein
MKRKQTSDIAKLAAVGALGVGLGYVIRRAAKPSAPSPVVGIAPAVITPSRIGGRRRALLIGASGGVGRALLHLLMTHPDGRSICDRLEALYIIDSGRHPISAPPGVRTLPAMKIDPEALARVVRDHHIDQVVEVASVDTRSASQVCAELGADYVSASITADGPILVEAERFWHDRPVARGTRQVIASGMNPGVVEALAAVAAEEFCQRVGSRDLALHGVHVTELDTTRLVRGADPQVFAMSWSPEHALDELLEPNSMFVASAGRVAATPHPVYAQLYAARVGDREVATMLVPHEELVAMASRWPGAEAGFFYAIPDAARDAIWRHPQRKPEQWKTQKLYHPHSSGLVGYDRVGCLLASRRYGELWAGFEHHAPHHVVAGNGTLLQTASGMLAAWTSLAFTSPGVRLVSELNPRAYLAVVQRVLGPYRIVHAPAAPVRSIADRAIRSLRRAAA